ncbi:Peroxidase stcC-like protein [Cladobotryum mycophilum]|uniref:Peroxidase stcC-like protein n=1 Tax=Cladobotryum mycophilum TaxID=491253 RepID=A0ABR0SS44_9HYPO
MSTTIQELLHNSTQLNSTKSQASFLQAFYNTYKMKNLFASLAVVSSLSSVGLALPQLPLPLPLPLRPILNPLDPRFHNFVPPGPGDSRSPCPGLNSLANHGFLPHDGRNITLTSLIIGAFQGLGVSPEISIAAGGGELAKSKRLAAFDLHELSDHGFIEHDCSYAREDSSIGNNNDFNATTWSVPLGALMSFSHISPAVIGKAKAARVRDNMKRNPKQECGARALAFGALENGMVLAVLGGNPPLQWLRTFMEEERLPSDQGWTPSLLLDDGPVAVTWGVESLVGEPDLVENLGSTIIQSPADLLKIVFPVKEFDMSFIESVITGAGFSSLGLGKLLGM